ncbi:MAG: tetratricopeptide repeat protein [Pseudomonadota bacterium]
MAEADFWGNAITCAEAETASAVRDFSEGLIKFDKKAGRVVGAAKKDPGCAIANAYAAMLMMFLELKASPKIAAPFPEAAQKAAPGATERERRIVDIAAKWVALDIPGLISGAKELLDDHPGDLTMVKIRQTMQFDWGDAPGMLHSARYGVKAHPNEPWALGMLAFGQEESHLLQEAETTAWRAIELDRAEGWAQHALAHVMLTQGRCDEGRGFLSGLSDTWEGKNSVLYCHNWWHVALFAISQGDNAGALAIYDDHITGQQPDYSQDQINEISLLARLELAGLGVGDRWSGLADRLASRSGDVVSPFLTLQYLYALARAGRDAEVDQLLSAIDDIGSGTAWNAWIWGTLGQVGGLGLVAHARGQWDAAANALDAAAPLFWKGGGSHAQRDLFHQIHLDALMRSGRHSEAQQILMGRLSFEPRSVPNLLNLAEVYDALGLEAEAADTRGRLH